MRAGADLGQLRSIIDVNTRQDNVWSSRRVCVQLFKYLEVTGLEQQPGLV